MYESQPHIYALAEEAYKRLLLTKESQSVIITGESGAGKTEASRIFLDYVATYAPVGDAKAAVIMQQIVDANVLLEAFGNAKTLKNDNSSRFGKWIAVQFDGCGVPVGGRITQYLLEKSRVCTRAMGERSFHVFYQFLGNASLVAKLDMTDDIMAYKYLRSSVIGGSTRRENAGDLLDVLACMTRLGWSSEEQDLVWRMVCAVLLLGNIEFCRDETKANVEAVGVAPASLNILRKVAALLSCDADCLEASLISRSLTTGAAKRKSSILVWLDDTQARQTRDALAKVVYERLFGFVLDRVNASIGSSVPSESMIGVLDIYGFEVFENNCFEQFLINYANEKLQQLFINLVLRHEQEEYLKEGIDWTHIDYFENQPIIEMIEGQPLGLLKLLDESCLVGQSTPDMLIQKYNQFFGKHPYYSSYETTNNLSIQSHSFTLKHYAGPVTYNLDNFLFKNHMFSSSLMVSGSKKVPQMAGQQFKSAINELVSVLSQCHPHYIRCIKSNDQKKPSYFDVDRVVNQLKYLNIVESVRVRKAGFCQKLHFNKFFERYKINCPSTWRKWNKTVKEGVVEIIKYSLPVGERNAECIFGKKKLFIRNAKTLYLFERAREANLPKAVVVIQKWWRGHKTRLWFKEELIRLQSEKQETQKLLEKKRAANLIQRVYYRYRVRSFLSKLVPWTRSPTYCKGRTMPTLWPKRRAFDDYVKKIHITWWAKVKVGGLTQGLRSLIRQKILALDLFGSGYMRKKEWQPRRRFMADYMSDDSNPKKAQFVEAVQNLFPRGDDKEILFADNVIKVNKRGKSQLRTLIITDQHIYKYDPKKYTRKKVGLKIHLINALCASNKRDTFLAIHFKAPVRDLFVNLGCDGIEKLSEVVTILVQRVYQLTNATIPLLLREPVIFNNSRDSRGPGSDWVVSFCVQPKSKEVSGCSFNKGKTNTAVVYYTND
eukprot:gene16755-19921_t